MPAHKPRTKRTLDLITQREIASILKPYNGVLKNANALQERLHKGAEIEPGELVLTNEYREPSPSGPTSILYIGGIEIRPTEMQEELPKWVYETAEDNEYELNIFNSAASDLERVPMTRTEYIALKKALAKIRGYVEAEVA